MGIKFSFKMNMEFRESILDNCLLDRCIDWIRSNFNPEDIFDDKDLERWAQENYRRVE
jgi:hypothetical protein